MADRGERGAEILKVGTKVGVMSMEITQSTRVVGVNSLGVLGRVHGRNRGFWDRGLRERDINHGLEMKQFRTGMGGVTNNITQSTMDGMLWRPRRGRVCRGIPVLLCPLASFALLTRSGRNRRCFFLR